MILSRAQRYILADAVMAHVGDDGILRHKDGDFEERGLMIHGIDFVTSFDRTGDTITIALLTLHTPTWDYFAEVGPDYIAYKMRGDLDQLDRDLSVIMLTGFCRSSMMNEVERIEASLARCETNPPAWAKAKRLRMAWPWDMRDDS